MTEVTFDIIVCVDNQNGIGLNGRMPWMVHADMKWFRQKTTEKPLSAVIMGRKTWQSLPDSFRPLPRRSNIIISRTLKKQNNVTVFDDFEKAVYDSNQKAPYTFIIGGATLYKRAVKHRGLRNLWITKLEKDYGCDTFFPDYSNLKKKETIAQGTEDGIHWQIEKWCSPRSV